MLRGGGDGGAGSTIPRVTLERQQRAAPRNRPVIPAKQRIAPISLSIPSPILEGAPRSPASGGSTPRGGGGSPTSPNPATTPREQAMRNNARGRPMLSGKILKNVLDSKPGPGSPQTPQTPVGVGRQVLVKLAPNDKEVYYFILVTTPREREQVFAFRRKIGMQVYSTAEESGDFADAYDDGAVHIGVWKEVQGNRGMLEKEPWAYARGHMTASNSPLKHYDFPLPRVVERMPPSMKVQLACVIDAFPRSTCEALSRVSITNGGAPGAHGAPAHRGHARLGHEPRRRRRAQRRRAAGAARAPLSQPLSFHRRSLAAGPAQEGAVVHAAPEERRAALPVRGVVPRDGGAPPPAL